MDAVDDQIEEMMAHYSAVLDQVRRGDEVETGAVPARIKKGAKELQKDVLGFEMMSFLSSELGVEDTTPMKRQSTQMNWMAYFKKSLESLLSTVLSATSDDIERQCFVSKIYCWYSECLRHQPSLTPYAGGANTENLDFSYRRPGYRDVSLARLSQSLLFQMAELPFDPKPPQEGFLPFVFSDSRKEKVTEHFHGIDTEDEEKDKAIYEIWLANRRQQALEAETKAQLAAKIEEHVSKRRPKSAGTTSASRISDLRRRPLSAMRRLAQMVVSKEPPKDAVVAESEVPVEEHPPSGSAAETVEVTAKLPPLPKPRRPLKRHDVYLYLSDSDDDVDRPLSSTLRRQQEEGTLSLNKSILARERPASSRRLYELSANDPELKVWEFLYPQNI